MSKFIVYKITCLANNKIYIGYTKYTAEQRLKAHFRGAKKSSAINNKFANAILKHGPNMFITEQLVEHNTKELAMKDEKLFIKKFNSVKSGYNSTYGGETGVTGNKHADVSGNKNPFFNKKHSDDTKIKIANRPYIKGDKHHFYGKPVTTSFKEGRDHPRSQPIVINGTTYESLSLAAKALGTYRQKIKELYLN